MAEEQVLKKKAIKEIVTCSEDPIYFIRNYCWVKHPHQGLVKFDLYDYQEKSVKAFLAYDRVIINKARQLGYSTLVAAFIVWLMLFHENKEIMIIATKSDVAKNLMRKIKLILSKLPDWMYLADVVKNDVHTVGLSNGSLCKAIPRSEDAGRSESLALLVVDEAAHIRDLKTLWSGLKSTVSTGGKIIMLSTPLGIGNLFYDIYSKAESGENGYKPILVNWWENPEYAEGIEEDKNVPGGYTSPWFRDFTEDMTPQQIRQELLTSFIESGETFLEPSIIKYYKSVTREPIDKILIDRNLWIWKKPVSGKKYLITSDVSGGGSGGEDYSTMTVIELNNCEVVAEYKGKVTPDVLAEFLYQVGEMYNNAYIVPENNGVGLATCLTLKRLDYKNIGYFDLDTGRLVDKWTADYKGINPGYPMTPKTRPIILAKFQEFLNKKYLITHSSRFINELFTFVVKNGKPQAASSCNDDLVMSTALAIWVRDVCPEFSSVNSSSEDIVKMYQSVSVSSTEFNLGNNDKERRVELQKQKIKQQMSERRVLLPNGNSINIDWMYKI